MKKLALILLTVLIGFNYSCQDDSTSPEATGEVAIYSSLMQTLPDGINIENEKKTGYQVLANSYVDSVYVTKVRFLISEIKMHNENNTESEGDHLVKAGPFLFAADFETNEIMISKGTVPIGNYDKIKFELHRFSESERTQYETDTDLADFATSDRYSVIIEGKYLENGNWNDFVYNGTVTANITTDFYSGIIIEDGELINVNLGVYVPLLFLDNDSYLDPTDDKNEGKIDNTIKDAFRAIQKIL